MTAPLAIQGPVFTDIVAKVLTIVDAVLNIFVTTTYTGTGGCCAPAGYTANLTDCGSGLACLLGQLVMQASGIGAYLMAALGASQG